MTRAVVVDDHPVFRQGLAVLLADLGLEVVGQADDDESVFAELGVTDRAAAIVRAREAGLGRGP